MKTQLFRNAAILAGLALIAPFSSIPSTARADIIVTVQEDSGPITGPTVLATGSPSSAGGVTSPSFTGTFGDFSITNGSASEIQVTTFSQAIQTALNIINNSGATHVLHITLQMTGFTQPTPSANMSSSFGGTSVSNPPGSSVGTATFQSSLVTLGANATPPQVVPLTPSFNDTVTRSVTGLPGLYSIFQKLDLTLIGGGNVNYTGRTVLTPTVVPEPGTIAMALTTLPVLGIGAFLRRRHRAKA